MIGELSGLASAAAWAMVSTTMRSVSNRVSPVVVNGLRCVFATINLSIIIVVLGRVGVLLALPLNGLAMLCISGLVGQGLGDAIFITSMKRIGAARAMPISSIQPLMTMILAVILLGERVTWLGALGTLLVLGSVYLLAFPYGPLNQVRKLFASADRAGVAMSIGAAVCWAISAVSLREALNYVDVLSATLVRMVVAGALLFGYQGLVARGRALSGLDARSLGIMALAGLLGTVSALGFINAVSFVGAAKSAVLSSTSPFFALPISVFVLHEKVNARVITGTVLCVAGIWMVLLG